MVIDHTDKTKKKIVNSKCLLCKLIGLIKTLINRDSGCAHRIISQVYFIGPNQEPYIRTKLLTYILLETLIDKSIQRETSL